jgi:hypothetical protein
MIQIDIIIHVVISFFIYEILKKVIFSTLIQVFFTKKDIEGFKEEKDNVAKAKSNFSKRIEEAIERKKNKEQ